MNKKSLQQLNRLTPEAFKVRKKAPFHIILDNFRSGLNTGSAFRTSDAFALGHLHLCGITAQPPHKEILKTAIGADKSMDWTHWDNVEDCLQMLQTKKVPIFGIEQTDESIFLQDWEMPETAELAFVFGNEVDGLSEETLPYLTNAIEIPQFGTKHSLNVSVTIGIIAWEIMRKRGIDLLTY